MEKDQPQERAEVVQIGEPEAQKEEETKDGFNAYWVTKESGPKAYVQPAYIHGSASSLSLISSIVSCLQLHFLHP